MSACQRHYMKNQFLKKTFARHIYYVNILFVFNCETSDKRNGLFKFGRNSCDYFFEIRKGAMALFESNWSNQEVPF